MLHKTKTTKNYVKRMEKKYISPNQKNNKGTRQEVGREVCATTTCTSELELMKKHTHETHEI